jgi:hypothetical protein
VDLLLETNLEAFLEPNLAFFAARDLDLAARSLWTGFIGSEPGHPILGRLIDSILHIVMHGAEEDLERMVLSLSPQPKGTELWKLRAAGRDECLYGGCALGMAANRILRPDNLLKDFQLGWQSRSKENGDVLILMVRGAVIGSFTVVACKLLTFRPFFTSQMSPDDMGALRFSDLERNILVASTKMIGLDCQSVFKRSTLSLFDRIRERQETR